MKNVWYKIIYNDNTWSQHHSIEEIIHDINLQKNKKEKIESILEITESELKENDLKKIFDKLN